MQRLNILFLLNMKSNKSAHAEELVISAIVPARGGSKRFLNKNLATINGDSLVRRKVLQLKEACSFQTIFVATDSHEIAEIAKNEDCEVLWRTPEWSDDEKAKSLSDTIAYLAEKMDAPHVYWAQCTSPFIDAKLISGSVQDYFDGIAEGYDSLISQQKVSDFLWQSSQPLNYGTGSRMVRSQDLPLLSRMTFGILMAPREKLIQWRYYHGPNPKITYLDKLQSIDIDDEFDYRLARCLASQM